MKWIKGFLQDRGLTIKLNDVLSEVLSPIYGVPQGSPLSPIYSSYMSVIYHNLTTNLCFDPNLQRIYLFGQQEKTS